MTEARTSILIVDDDKEDLLLVERAVRPMGSEIFSVKDPHEVLPTVHRKRPDVVILDALLPGLSGFDLCKQIKTDPQLKGTQVLILTGVYLRQQYRNEALQQFKADAFLTKPFRPPELQRLVAQLLSRRTRTPQASFLKRIGLPVGSEPKKRGLLGRLFSRGESEEEPMPARIAPVPRPEASEKAAPDAPPPEESPDRPDGLHAPRTVVAPEEASPAPRELPAAESASSSSKPDEVTPAAHAIAARRETTGEELGESTSRESLFEPPIPLTAGSDEEGEQDQEGEGREGQREEQAPVEPAAWESVSAGTPPAETAAAGLPGSSGEAMTGGLDKGGYLSAEASGSSTSGATLAVAGNGLGALEGGSVIADRGAPETASDAEAESANASVPVPTGENVAEPSAAEELDAPPLADSEKVSWVKVQAQAQAQAPAKEPTVDEAGSLAQAPPEAPPRIEDEPPPEEPAARPPLDAEPPKLTLENRRFLEALASEQAPAAATGAEAKSETEPAARPDAEKEPESTAAPSAPVETRGRVRRRLTRWGNVPIYEEEDFFAELKRELSKCRRVDRPLTVILIQVGDLSQIVELFGREYRDAVLWHVAEQATASLREVDLVGMMSSNDRIAMTAFASDRYGGGRIISRMRKAVQKNPFRVGGEIPPIIPVLHFGMATFPQDGDDVSGLMQRAEGELSARDRDRSTTGVRPD
jgi:diguanylate cyclase (GGDEF)-like protein